MNNIEMEKARAWIVAARTRFDTALAEAQKAVDAQLWLSGAVWAQVAADLAFNRHPGIFVSSELEGLLGEIARHLPSSCSSASHVNNPKPSVKGKPRILHVATNTYGTGGHTRLIERFAGNSSENYEHFLVTTAQRGPLPERLRRAFCTAGNNWLDLSTPGSDLLSRGMTLRGMSREIADVIFLHIHPFDVVPAVAFGIPGGPPVVILNHADHLFWVGASIADVVADIRLAGQQLTLNRRQIPTTKILPIPLADGRETVSIQERLAARERLGIDSDAIVLLTIATPYKYTPLGEYNFFTTITDILMHHQNTILLACGPDNSGVWKEASELVNGRIRAFGGQSNLADFHAAADIYLDPFPFASLTSLLETSLYAVPAVGMANQASPIFTDGSIIAGDGWTHASTNEEYTALVGELITDSEIRIAQGKRLMEQTVARHLLPEWGKYLNDLLGALPSTHAVRTLEARSQAIDGNDLFLASMNQLNSGRHSLNTALRKHGGCFPVKERLRLLLKGLFGVDGIKPLPLSTYAGKEMYS
ncbi:MAG: hypothetical protein PHF56_04565 [Desulfuromonadaceae bacterium]|nr:hypothetical protein [Desulfuromonadaceae bacterium]